MKNTKITIYHGSISIIKNPEFGKGKPYNDYGRGFYCTKDIELAKEWAVTEQNDGYANIYEIDIRGLKVLHLSKKQYTTLHWMSLLVKNRTFVLSTDISKEAKAFLINNYSIDISQYDIVVGYRADDSYFTYADYFLNNNISLEKLSCALKLGNLGEQIVLISKKAFSKLHFLGYEKADKETYYPKRNERNIKARKQFFDLRGQNSSLEETYILDIMRGKKNG